MHKISNFPESPYSFKNSSTSPVQNPWPIPPVFVKKIFFHILELGPDSLKSMGALRSTCRFMWNVANTPALWEVICKSLPFTDRDICNENDYYNLCKEYKNVAQALAQKKYWKLTLDDMLVYTKNIFQVESPTELDYICNLSRGESYGIEKKIPWIQRGEFFLYNQDNLVHIFDLFARKVQVLNLGNGKHIFSGKHDLDDLHISMPEEFTHFGNKFLLSLYHDAESKKIYMKTWDMKTEKCEKSKQILDTSKSRSVKFFFEKLPYIMISDRKRKRDESHAREITIYDIEKDKEYSYSFKLEEVSYSVKYMNEGIICNAGNLPIADDSIESVHFPYITDRYIVYLGTAQDGLAFLNRESGEIKYVNLGSADKNFDAMASLHRLSTFGSSDNFARIFQKENIFMCCIPKDSRFELWNILTGKKIDLTEKQIDVCKNAILKVSTHSIIGVEHSVLGSYYDKIIIFDSYKECYRFLDLNLNYKFSTEEGDEIVHINERYHIVDYPAGDNDEGFIELSQIQIYDTVSEKTIFLNLTDLGEVAFCCELEYADSDIITALWGNFLAIPGRLTQGTSEELNEDEGLNKTHIFIFDILNGQYLGSIPLGLEFNEGFIANLEWLNGCLKVEHVSEKGAEPTFICLAFHKENPFLLTLPKDFPSSDFEN